jgi:hypothetical protein
MMDTHVLGKSKVTMLTNVPDQITSKLRDADLDAAVDNLNAWIRELGLGVAQVRTKKIPTYQIVIPLGARSHPLLTLQPPPRNPDVPLQKMKGLRGSPFANGGPRQGIVEQLNAQLPETERKPITHRNEFYTIRWRHFADAAEFLLLRSVLDSIISRVRPS